VSLRVHLKRLTKYPRVDTGGAKRFARDVLLAEGVQEGAVSLVLTDDEGIRKLNARFRDRDRPTDVLAFPLHEEGEDGVVYLGDVAVSLERAVAQAPRFHNLPEAELARLIAHGLLHLIGYDHHTPAEGRRMKAAERRALARLLPDSLLPEGGGLRA